MTDIHKELSPLMGVAFDTTCKGYKIATQRLTEGAPSNDEEYLKGVKLMDVGSAVMRLINNDGR